MTNPILNNLKEVLVEHQNLTRAEATSLICHWARRSAVSPDESDSTMG